MEFNLRDRIFLEALEDKNLSFVATKSASYGQTRLHAEPEHPYRTAFQRDRDRILHSRAFRRLKHKRQVFLTHFGDHYRTRLTHTLEVAQISRTMARSLGVNEDLTEAIALGHDLGHTPFGHLGEMVLHRIMSGEDNLDGLLPASCAVGGYKHNYQSVRVVDLIEKKYPWPGLNLTSAVREGLLKHTRLRRTALQYPDFNFQGLYYSLDHATTLEGQLVAVSDEIAQRTHDLEDGIRAGYVTMDDVGTLPIMQRIQERSAADPSAMTDDYLKRNQWIRTLINFLVTDVLEETRRRIQQLDEPTSFIPSLMAWFSEAVHPLQEELDRFIDRRIIHVAIERHSDQQAIQMLRHLFQAYYRSPELLPAYLLQRFSGMVMNPFHTDALPKEEQAIFLRVICDHIAGMSDRFAELEFKRIEGR